MRLPGQDKGSVKVGPRAEKLQHLGLVDLDLGQEGMVPMETNMIMEEMMEDGLDDACNIM